MVELLFLLFVFELSLFVIVDYYKYSTVFTPALFLGAPFAFVLFLAVFVCSSHGFFPVTASAVVLWCLGLFLFWLSGSFLTFAVIKGRVAFLCREIETDNYITLLVRCVSWVFIFFLLLSFVRSYSTYGTIGGDDFSEAFASHGIAAHCLSLLKFNAAFLASVNDEKRFQNTIIVLLTFVFLVLYNVKGGIILTALVCLFSRQIMSRSKINVFKIFIIVVLGMSFFALSYLVSLGSIDLDFIVAHFFAYVVAGIVGLSEHLRHQLPVDYDVLLIFQPLRNIYVYITGGEVAERISDFWVTTSVVYAKKSNVKTFFGDIYIYAGLMKGALIVSILGLSSYCILICTVVLRRLLFLILYLFVISAFMLGWFNFYFNDLFYYEMILYVVFITSMGYTLKLLFGRTTGCELGTC